jgi:TolB-like protein
VASEHVERKLAAILAADVAGYSRLTGADEEGTMRRLRALRAELIDPAIQTNRGRVFHTAGDSILIEFASVVDAVRCSLDVQRGMAVRNGDFVPEKQIEFRVGIHLGDVMVQPDGDLLGDGVNVAARLEGIAEPGGICLSNAAYDQVRDKLKESFVDLGEKDLKNIARPVRVFSVALNGVAKTATVASSAPSTVTQSAARLSIVVLPFANIGGDPEQDYFVDGVTESLTTDLSRISGSFVIARNTAFTYKGKQSDVKQIGRELNVRYALEGSVQRGGNRLRVNVQLIDAESGNHLWAERFDKPVADLFDMQDEIVARLANQLGTQLVAAEARRAARAANPDSMDLYFQGMAWANGGAGPKNFSQARALFERALALDSDNIEALVGRAWMQGVAPLGADDPATPLAAAEATLSEVLSVAPDHAFAHFLMGFVQVRTGRTVGGIAEMEHALALDRNLATAHAFIGDAKYHDDRAEETERHVLEAFRLSPRDHMADIWMVIAGYAKLLLGAHEEAIAWLRRSIEANRNFPVTHFLLAATLVELGRLDEARSEVRAGLALGPTFTIRRMHLGAGSGSPNYAARNERILDGLRRAGMPEG